MFDEAHRLSLFVINFKQLHKLALQFVEFLNLNINCQAYCFVHTRGSQLFSRVDEILVILHSFCSQLRSAGPLEFTSPVNNVLELL